jgi:hypothetical protein
MSSLVTLHYKSTMHISGLLSQVIDPERAEIVTAIVFFIVSKCVRKLYIMGFIVALIRQCDARIQSLPRQIPPSPLRVSLLVTAGTNKAAFLMFRQTDRVDETYLITVKILFIKCCSTFYCPHCIQVDM